MATISFPQATSVPVLDLGQVHELARVRMATLIGDLNDLLFTTDCTMTDFVCYTDPLKTSE